MKYVILIIILFLSGCNNMIINSDVKVMHINVIETQMSAHSVKDSKSIKQIVDIINGASKEPAMFKAKLEIEFDSMGDRILVKGHYFKFQGITYHTDFDLEQWLNALIYD